MTDERTTTLDRLSADQIGDLLAEPRNQRSTLQVFLSHLQEGWALDRPDKDKIRRKLLAMFAESTKPRSAAILAKCLLAMEGQDFERARTVMQGALVGDQLNESDRRRRMDEDAEHYAKELEGE